MSIVVMANLISMVGCALMVAVGFLQKKRQILLVQCVQFAIQGTAHILLGAGTGFVSSVVGIVRNLIFVRKENTGNLKLLFIAIQVAISLYVGIHGFIDWFPIFAAVLFTWCLDTKSEVHLKLVIITAQVMWFLYDYVYINYVGCVFDGLTILSNTIGICMILWKSRRA